MGIQIFDNAFEEFIKSFTQVYTVGYYRVF